MANNSKHEVWLTRIAVAVDVADRNNDSILLYSAIRRCRALSLLAPDDVALQLNYFISNCWSAIERIRALEMGRYEWYQEGHVEQVFYLRSIINSPSFIKLSKIRRNQVITNYGNIMNTLGRFMTALDAWNQAISSSPDFAAALGSRGFGLICLAKHLPDVRHKLKIAAMARQDLKSAISSAAFWDSGQEIESKLIIMSHLEYVNNFIDSEKETETKLNEIESQDDYMSWCEEKSLLIDALNFPGSNISLKYDHLHLPPHRYESGDGALKFVNYFNQLKSSFAYTRRILYEGDMRIGYDHNPKNIYDSGDNAIYGSVIENYKSTIRDAYSIFDKISLFVNDYFSINEKPSSVNFRKIWYDKMKEKNGLRAEFSESRNWPLKGLFYLSKDLFDKQFVGIADPDGETIDKIRNQIEHRYLAVTQVRESVLRDDAIMYINIADLRDYAFQIMQKAREAIVLLSLSVHAEEYKRKCDSSKDGIEFVTIKQIALPAPAVPKAW